MLEKADSVKMSNLDFIIYRPAKALAAFISLVILVLFVPKAFVLLGASFGVYRILYYQRASIYKLGKGRFFLLGIVALLPFLFSPFIEYELTTIAKNWEFIIGRYIQEDNYFNAVNAWIFENADSIFRWKFGLIFSLAYGVFLYVMNVELDNKEIKKIDIHGLKLPLNVFNNYNELWRSGFNFLAVGVLFLYSVPLSFLYLGYVLSVDKLSYKTKTIVDGITLMICSMVAIPWFDLEAILTTPKILMQYIIEQGLLATIQADITQFTDFTVQRGIFALVAMPLLIRNVVNITGKEVVKEYEKQQEKKQEITEENGVFLGFDTNKNPVIVSDAEFNQHCLILGSTGSGKTTTIFNIVDSALSRGLPVVFMDGKGENKLVKKLDTLCKNHGRTLRVFALDADIIPKSLLNHYNPFGSGNFTEWKNRVMALFQMASGRGQEHFALAEENYINLVCQVLHKTGKEIDLRVLLAFLEHPEQLVNVAAKIDSLLAQKLAVSIEANKEITGDVIKLLELFFYSSYGHLFDTQGKPTITLKDSIKNGEVVLFMFNASSYPQDTKKVAKMVINDINSSFAEISNEQGFTKCYCVFDEFASYASENLSESISLHRSNGLHAIVGTQSLKSVSLKSEETKRIAEELIACCNTFITQRIGHLDDIELMAKTMGTQKTYEVTAQVNTIEGGATGLGTAKYIDEFIVNPQEIRELGTGEGFIYRKALQMKPYKVKFNFVV